jgi:BirA family transcriptional regulator, biotin operon repressor / biotin---[acetyl-CoA-carboxylase] ligase
MMQLDPKVAATGVRLIAHDRIGSTNAEALRLSREGEPGPLWVTAEQQSAGRGRRGRNWASPAGNLHATLLLTDPAPAEHWPELSLVTALAVHDAVAELAQQLRPLLAIKWPNDLLLAGAKFAGILIEGEGSAVAVGIGVDCASHPADTDYPATDLAAAGAKISAESLFTALSVKMLGRIAQWNGGAGFSTIRADWLARAAGRGAPIRVRLADRELAGIFESLDETGRLVLLRPDGGRETVAAGDVVALQGSGGSPLPSRRGEG